VEEKNPELKDEIVPLVTKGISRKRPPRGKVS
jgi:hypothetical protein